MKLINFIGYLSIILVVVSCEKNNYAITQNVLTFKASEIVDKEEKEPIQYSVTVFKESYDYDIWHVIWLNGLTRLKLEYRLDFSYNVNSESKNGYISFTKYESDTNKIILLDSNKWVYKNIDDTKAFFDSSFALTLDYARIGFNNKDGDCITEFKEINGDNYLYIERKIKNGYTWKPYRNYVEGYNIYEGNFQGYVKIDQIF